MALENLSGQWGDQNTFWHGIGFSPMGHGHFGGGKSGWYGHSIESIFLNAPLKKQSIRNGTIGPIYTNTYGPWIKSAHYFRCPNGRVRHGQIPRRHTYTFGRKRPLGRSRCGHIYRSFFNDGWNTAQNIGHKSTATMPPWRRYVKRYGNRNAPPFYPKNKSICVI